MPPGDGRGSISVRPSQLIVVRLPAGVRDFSLFLTGLDRLWKASNPLCGEYRQLFTRGQPHCNVNLMTRHYLVQKLIRCGTEAPLLRTRLYGEHNINIAQSLDAIHSDLLRKKNLSKLNSQYKLKVLAANIKFHVPNSKCLHGIRVSLFFYINSVNTYWSVFACLEETYRLTSLLHNCFLELKVYIDLDRRL